MFKILSEKRFNFETNNRKFAWTSLDRNHNSLCLWPCCSWRSSASHISRHQNVSSELWWDTLLLSFVLTAGQRLPSRGHYLLVQVFYQAYGMQIFSLNLQLDGFFSFLFFLTPVNLYSEQNNGVSAVLWHALHSGDSRGASCSLMRRVGNSVVPGWAFRSAPLVCKWS